MSEIKREIVGEEKLRDFPCCADMEAALPTLSLSGTVHVYELTNGEYRITIKANGHQEHIEFLTELWDEAGHIMRGES